MDEIDYGKGTAAEKSREWRLTGIIFFGLLAFVALYATFMIVQPFLSAIVLGAILVTITYPLYARLRDRLNGRYSLAALLMLLFLTLVVIIPAAIIGFLLVQQADVLVHHLRSGEAQKLMQRMDIAGHLMWVKRFIPDFDPNNLNPQRFVLPVLQQVPGWVASNGPAVVGSIAGAVLAFALVLLSSYFFYVEGASIIELLAIWGILVVSTIENIVGPWAMKGKSELPAIPLLFAVIGGMQAFGFIGLVIGPLVFSLLMSIINIYKRSFGIRDA